VAVAAPPRDGSTAFEFGMSAIPTSLAHWHARCTDLVSHFIQYADTNRLHILFVMYLYRHADQRTFMRQLSIVVRRWPGVTVDAAAVLPALEQFLAEKSVSLEPLPPHQTPDMDAARANQWLVRHYQQLTVTVSRKNLSPLLEEFFSRYTF
jgi:hypothetical protein